MRTHLNQWRSVDNPQDKARGRLQSNDPMLVSRVWNDLLAGRPISVEGPSGQSVSLDRDRPRILCDATVARRTEETGTNEGFRPHAHKQRQENKKT